MKTSKYEQLIWESLNNGMLENPTDSKYYKDFEPTCQAFNVARGLQELPAVVKEVAAELAIHDNAMYMAENARGEYKEYLLEKAKDAEAAAFFLSGGSYTMAAIGNRRFPLV